MRGGSRRGFEIWIIIVWDVFKTFATLTRTLEPFFVGSAIFCGIAKFKRGRKGSRT